MISFFRKLARLARRPDGDDQVTAELQFHLEEEAGDRRANGASEEEARWAARRELGNIGLVAEETRAVWSWTFVEQLRQDLRYAARTIRRNPAFTLLAALSLALGIGANTAIYSFLDALLMRSLPVADPQSLAVLNWHVSGKKNLDSSVMHSASGYIHDDPEYGRTTGIFPYPFFDLLRRSNDVFSVLFAYHPAKKLNLSIQGHAEIAGGEYVSGDFFRGLALAPAAGRLIDGEDDRAGAPPVVVLSYAYAKRRFGDAAAAAGRPVLINNLPFTAIGVAPTGFFGVDPGAAPDFYLPLHADLALDRAGKRRDGDGTWYLDEHYYWMEIMARLKPGVTIAQAQAAVGPVFARWVAATAATDTERNNLPEFLVRDGARGLNTLRREYSQPFAILLALAGLILAIACANIANLLLARATARKREMAVRLSMGAGRGRVIRQMLTESLLLASIGGAAGILLAAWGMRALTALLAAGSDDFTLRGDLNWHVLAAAVALTMLTGVLFGLAPALQATRTDVVTFLKEGRAGGPRSRMRLRFGLSQALVVSQIAISLLLLAAAGLFVRTLSNLQSVEMGFQRDHLLVFRVNARQAGHADPEILSFYRDLSDRLSAIPGMRSASMANSPLIGEGAWGWPVVPEGKPRPAKHPSGHGTGMSPTSTRVLAAGPGFFQTMRIPLVAGREFNNRDRLGSPPVAMVNEAWVKVNLEGRNAVGQHIVSYGREGPPQEQEIVGVVKNARYDYVVGEFPAIVYMPVAQTLSQPADEMTYFLRTAGNPAAIASAVRETVHRADPRVPVTNLETQAAQIDRQMSQEIVFARLCTGFAILALAIACVGLYGTMSYRVARARRRSAFAWRWERSAARLCGWCCAMCWRW